MSIKLKKISPLVFYDDYYCKNADMNVSIFKQCKHDIHEVRITRYRTFVSKHHDCIICLMMNNALMMRTTKMSLLKILPSSYGSADAASLFPT